MASTILVVAAIRTKNIPDGRNGKDIVHMQRLKNLFMLSLHSVCCRKKYSGLPKALHQIVTSSGEAAALPPSKP